MTADPRPRTPRTVTRTGPADARRRGEARAALRQSIWDRLVAEKLARFPYPPHGRIPNFADAEQAAQRLFELPALAGARRIKVNPDAPQRPVRLEALRRGIQVYLPTPRLRGGFRCLDPERIPPASLRAAASLSRGARFARPVALRALPRLDALVVGSVAVSRRGGRLGKGEGYADIEYAILRSLGQPPLPVFTSVHEVQIVPRLPRQPNDLPLHAIATPERIVEIRPPPPAPEGIDWARLPADALERMPVLRELRAILGLPERA